MRRRLETSLSDQLRDAIRDSEYRNPRMHLIPVQQRMGMQYQLEIFGATAQPYLFGCPPHILDMTLKLVSLGHNHAEPYGVSKGLHDTALHLASNYNDLFSCLLVWAEAIDHNFHKYWDNDQREVNHMLGDFQQGLKSEGIEVPSYRWHHKTDSIVGTTDWAPSPRSVDEVAGWLCAVASAEARKFDIVVGLSGQDAEVERVLKEWK